MSVVKKFHRDFKDFKIRISDWEILDKGVTLLWGPSGSGKSTVIRGLLGLDADSTVQWEFRGRQMDKLPVEKRNLGAVFQDLGLFPHLSAKANILFPVQSGVHKRWKKDFDFLVETLEVGKVLNHPVFELSGGEKQRVALARSLIYRPEMLMLDEPFSSLDEALRAKMRSMVLSVCEELDCPILLVSHDQKDVDKMASKVTSIADGKIVKEESLKG